MINNKEKVTTPKENIMEMLKYYVDSDEHAESLLNRISCLLIDYPKRLNNSIEKYNSTGEKDDNYEEAMKIKKRVVQDVKKLIEDSEGQYFYFINDKDEIEFNPNGFFNEDNTIKEDFEELSDTFHDIYYDEGEFYLYNPYEDITYEEYKYLESLNFDINSFKEMMKKKYINKTNEVNSTIGLNKIRSIKINDYIPVKDVVNYRILLCKEDEPKPCDTKGFDYDLKEMYVKYYLGENLLYSINSLHSKYGIFDYIDYIYDFIDKTRFDINIPVIPREVMIKLVEEKIKNEDLHKYTFKEIIFRSLPLKEDEWKEFISSDLKHKFKKEELKRLKNMLINQKSDNKTLKM